MEEMAANIRRLPPAEFWVVWALLVVGALVAFYYAFRQWHRARIIEDAPTAKIRSAPQGYVELEGVGRMMAGEPIISPLTAKNCLWFRYKVERKETVHIKDTRTTRWRVVEQGVSDALFLLEDETGQCVIDPDGAEVTPLDTLVWYGDTPRPMDVPLLGRGRIGFGASYRYTETFIMAGQPLYVLGQFQTIRAVDGYSSAEIARDLIRSWKSDQRLLLAHFDTNRDGKVDAREWETVRQLARRKAEAEFRQRLREPDTHLVCRPEDGGRPYLLSSHPQEGLSRRYRRHGAVALTLFFILGVVAVWGGAVRFAG